MVQVSLIIPTHDRAAQLLACLEALRHQTQPFKDWEVVVVVDGSTDTTIEKLAAFQPPYALRVITQPSSGQCAALNRGVTEARGKICIFLDDDVLAAPRLVAEHLRLHNERGCVVGIGHMPLTEQANADWFARTFAIEWNERCMALNSGNKRPTWEDCYGSNMSVARETYLEAGGYSEDLPRGYDLELAYRLHCHGCSFVYLREALGHHNDLKGFRALITDTERGGASSVEIYRKHPATLPALLGSYRGQTPRMGALLALLLELNPPSVGLEQFGRFLAMFAGTRDSYRVLRRYSFWRGVRHALADEESWSRLTYATPMLMYHAFAAPGDLASRFVLPARSFAQQMAWLKRTGYRVLSLEQYLRYRIEYGLAPARSVVITIDDGYLDNWEFAYPVLRQHNFPATIFLVSERMGGANDWDVGSTLTGRPIVSWHQVRKMRERGIEFGAHTRTHPDLTSLSLKMACEEIDGSKRDLERQLGVPIRAFSYPYGKHTPALEALVEEVGFLGSGGIKEGRNTPITPLHDLRRVEVYGTDTLFQFALAVRLGFRPRSLWKRTARR